MNRYPSDEELNAFIEQLEMQELYAPSNLKQQILNQTKKKEAKNKSVQMFTYSFKVAAGMAAAIVMLTVLPMFESRAAYPERLAYIEQKQLEEYKEWEDAQMKKVQKKEKKEAILQQNRENAEKKLTDVLETFNGMWNKEAEEN